MKKLQPREGSPQTIIEPQSGIAGPELRWIDRRGRQKGTVKFAMVHFTMECLQSQLKVRTDSFFQVVPSVGLQNGCDDLIQIGVGAFFGICDEFVLLVLLVVSIGGHMLRIRRREVLARLVLHVLG